MLEDEDATVQTDDSAQQETVDWQKRYTDTQAEYTKQQQALKDEQSVWEDEQALLARIAEKHPHLIAEDETVEDDDSSDDDDEPEHLTKAEFTAWQKEQKAQQDAKESAAQFKADQKRFVGDRELSHYGNDWIISQAGRIKNATELEKVVEEWFSYEDELRGSRKSKRAPHVPTGGKAATGVPNYDDMNHDQAVEAMVARARALDTQT